MRKYIQDYSVLIVILLVCGIIGHLVTRLVGFDFKFTFGFIAGLFYYVLYKNLNP